MTWPDNATQYKGYIEVRIAERTP